MSEPVFTTHWEDSRDYWQEMFDELGWAGRPNLRFLEIGCFEGQASLWMLENVLTDPTSSLTVIDPFEIERDDTPQFHRFARNLGRLMERVAVSVGRSQDVLISDVRPQMGPYDFIYVDGSHTSADVLADAVLAWPLLKPAGLMVFDDYQWDDVVEDWKKPQIAVDAFVRCYQAHIASAKRRGKDQFVVVKGS